MKLTFKIVLTNGNAHYSVSEFLVFGHETGVVFFEDCDGNNINIKLSDIRQIKHVNIK